MREGTDKIKFQREQIKIKERSPVTDPGEYPPLGIEDEMPSGDREGWRGADGVRTRGSAGPGKKQGRLSGWRR